MASDAGLAAAAYGSYYRVGTSEAQDLAFAAVADTARELCAPTVRVWAGTKGSAETTPEERAAVVADLVRIAEIASGAGLTVSLEFHGNTLTDTAASTVALLNEAAHPALRSLWQPAVGRTSEERRADLAAVTPWLGNVHVFQWEPNWERRPLAEGEAAWPHYLDVAKGENRYALLEFVEGDAPEAFLRDAAVLKRWLAEDAKRG
jgi:sugar phosphate isomerase/epimerase